MKTLKGLRFGWTVSLGVFLRHLVGGQSIRAHHLLLAGRVIPAHGAVVFDAVDIRHKICKDRDLASERVCGI